MIVLLKFPILCSDWAYFKFPIYLIFFAPSFFKKFADFLSDARHKLKFLNNLLAKFENRNHLLYDFFVTTYA